jgi:hypothetical protein
MQSSTLRLVGFAASILLALAVLPLPYGYYRFLRLAVTAAACVLAYYSQQKGKEVWMLAFVAAALLFNPVIRVPLEREVWAIFNVIFAASFAIGTLQLTRTESKS